MARLSDERKIQYSFKINFFENLIEDFPKDFFVATYGRNIFYRQVYEFLYVELWFDILVSLLPSINPESFVKKEVDRLREVFEEHVLIRDDEKLKKAQIEMAQLCRDICKKLSQPDQGQPDEVPTV